MKLWRGWIEGGVGGTGVGIAAENWMLRFFPVLSGVRFWVGFDASGVFYVVYISRSLFPT